MDRFLEFVVDKVFSFGTFCILGTAGFIFLMFNIVDSDIKRQEATRVATEACYSQGMVLVRTDAGERCVDPRTLVKVR